MYLTYETIKKMTEGEEFPFFFLTDMKEKAYIVPGNDGVSSYYIVTILQSNGWCRIKTYHEDGEVVEEYKRSV